jgi:hypothetical protein
MLGQLLERGIGDRVVMDLKVSAGLYPYLLDGDADLGEIERIHFFGCPIP